MISVEEAKRLVLDSRFECKIIKTPILDSLGKVLAEDIAASEDIPIYDNSAMDGYAVIANDVKGADKSYPITLMIAGGSIPAGKVPNTEIEPGSCIPIMTGAVMPKGSDSVVMKEDVQRDGKSILVFREVKPGDNVRYRGEDIKKSDIVLKNSEVISPAVIGVLASLGIRTVKTFQPPRIGVIATGDELLEIDKKLKKGMVRDSNSYSLSAQIMETGAEYNRYGIIRDDEEVLKKSIKKALKENDILLLSGGISVGDYDFVKDTLEDIGADLIFWRVNQKPGKPLAFFKYKDRFIFGLPGNPVSVMVCFEIYVRPLIRKMMGFEKLFRAKVIAEALHEFRNKKGRANFARVILEKKDGKYFFSSTGMQGSGILTSMVKANGIAFFPSDIGDVKKGNIAEVYVF
ncbi:MAG: molybdopterin molybdotransferase MoeA [Actinomycetia bacterium]|nr:molybdopterin molybdotransferase MoeA [Actinomycetes bacterium]